MTFWKYLRIGYAIVADAIGHFIDDDGPAIASHVALSSLMAIFPFLIFVAALSGFIGFHDVAEMATDLIFEAWPKQVAGPVSSEIDSVLTQPRGDLLTFGVIVTLWFSSNGVEAVRAALNRSYRVKETRSWIWCRVQSIIAVLIGSIVLMIFTLLIIVGPLVWSEATKLIPHLANLDYHANIIRYGGTSVLLIIALFVAHLVLPNGKRGVLEVLPGVFLTVFLWVGFGSAFGIYLANFAHYVSLYAGLAGIMTALIFMYLTAAIFIIGGEFNAAILRQRNIGKFKKSKALLQAASSVAQDGTKE
ncbi:YihY/virulence factor BrkB family protein [Flexibacterium corallicola]|uniref:YihY/virulence factor BrkB family protein n=1 Tax=Flexibacterium corallicola TaxID=3037259 RepID=UPI00286EC0A0|nr:YihY/virulence factor BrkB family protein [Pseudovibrio sp. M1P-2-3]